jgi:cytoskeletal protein RodZ
MSHDPLSPAGDGLGALLRDARERAGLDLSEVAARTHVRRAYLQALEDEDLDALPEDVYARNFVRLFARTVGLDADEALSAYGALRSRQRGRTTGVFRTDAATPSEAAPRERSAPATEAAAPARAPRRSVPTGPSPLRGLVPLIATLVLAGVLIGTAVWGFNQLLFRSDQGGISARADRDAAGDAAAAPSADAPAAADGATEGATQPSGLAAPALPGGAELPAEVLLTVTTEPAGAEVSIDAFPLPGTTPIEAVPVTAREARTLRIVRDGYLPYEASVDLSRDRELRVVLEPVPDAEASAAGPSEAGVVVEVREASWLEAYQSTERGQGARLAYTTAQPGERYVFQRPVYLHVGNAGGLDVFVDGEPIAPLGSGGAVTGRAFPAP